jgi:hypothetical protein
MIPNILFAQIRITHAALSLVGFQNNNRPFPVRERTFGELANGLLFWKPTNDNAACNSNLKAMNSDRSRTSED